MVLTQNDFFNPNYTDLMQITRSLILAEGDVKEKLLEEINFIEDNTSEDVNIPLSVIELCVYQNRQRGTQYEVTLYEKQYTISELHRICNHVIGRLCRIVISIAKRYSLEVEFRGESDASKKMQNMELKIGD
jgi:hypothetical protein